MKKKLNLYLILFLVLIVVVGSTIAYFQSTSILENLFGTATYKTVTT